MDRPLSLITATPTPVRLGEGSAVWKRVNSVASRSRSRSRTAAPGAPSRQRSGSPFPGFSSFGASFLSPAGQNPRRIPSQPASSAAPPIGYDASASVRSSLSPPILSGDGDDEGCDGSSVMSRAPMAVTFLPEDAPAELETRVSAMLSTTHWGVGRCYAARFRNVVKTQATQKGAWVFDAATCMWKLLELKPWTSVAQQWIAKEISTLAARVNACLEKWRYSEKGDDHGVAMRKLWTSALKRVTMANELLSVPAMKHVMEVVHTELLDEEFCSTFDHARDILPFTNGVVELRTGVLRGVRLEDKLTYVLPYAYDPDLPTPAMTEFMAAVMPDADARAKMQVVAGYFFTGDTTLKTFYQMSAEANSGKTTLLEIIANAGGRFVVMNRVPVEELSAESNFEDTIAEAFAQRPYVRLIVFDETKAGLQLSEKFINMVTSGLESIEVPCRIKGKKAVQAAVRSKLVFSSNHVLKTSAAATGQTLRREGAPFQTHFIRPGEPYDPLTAPPHHRLPNYALVSSLMSPAARPEIAKWIVEGSRKFYESGIPKSEAWDRQTFKLNAEGDDYLRWLSETHFPTGQPEDRIAEDVLHEMFKSVNKHLRGDTRAGLRAALSTMSDYITPVKWGKPEPFYCAGGPPANHPVEEVSGYAGLRPRCVGDPQWESAMANARRVAGDLRRAVAEDV